MDKQALKSAVAELSERASRMTEEDWLHASIAMAIVAVSDEHCRSIQVKEALESFNAVMGDSETTDEQAEHAARRVSVEFWTWVRR